MIKALEKLTHDVPNASVIWLHGLGADGHDFYDIVSMLELPSSAKLRFIFPHAPTMPVTLNGGLRMPSWYDIVGIGEQFPYDIEGINVTQARILQLIDYEIERGIPLGRIILAGFSQGGVIALHTSLRLSSQLAGVLALSCYLAVPNKLLSECKSPTTLDILMMHGKDDTVVAYEYGKKSAATITNAGYKVVWKGYSMPHSVCSQQLLDIGVWISKRLNILRKRE